MKIAKRPRGRPLSEIEIPEGKFIFTDLVKQNPWVTPLTLRRFVERDALKRNKSEIVLLDIKLRIPMGRPKRVYIKRSKKVKGK